MKPTPVCIVRSLTASTVLALALASHPASSQDKVLNLYSSRHYNTDEALYANFTKQTGIRINRIEAPEDALLQRIQNEGAASPADVLVTVDAGRLWRAEQMGLFQPVQSPVLDARIPANLHQPDGLWFGFSTRARIIIFAKDRVKPEQISTYEDLADPKWKGKVCMRSSSNMYNLSLMSALIDHLGEPKAEAWARGVVANFARSPKGGDTDQIKAVAAGECALSMVNTYYYVRMLKSSKPDERAAIARVGTVWPNQNGSGTHVNISGAGVLKTAPNRDAGVKFLEYLASDEAQRYFANGNNEFTAVSSVSIENRELASLGKFKADRLNVGALGKNQPAAQRAYDRAGWR
ncbi:MAG: Fe(3+) ABC transporter substrate-binding protein [Betaproteobacteria bacterium]|nr:Fe(3+) ABC transporter substrate-binding protein [Betaproteobacteria bacterium]